MSFISYFEKTKITNTTGTAVNPAEEESIILLRRVVKLLESSATVDPRNRQRITLDAIKASEASVPTEIAGTVPVSGNIGTAIVANPISGNPPYTTASTALQPIFEGPVDQRWRVAEASHEAYQLGIRSHLTFT